jgi:putative ABC transport system substrate-binding protein
MIANDPRTSAIKRQTGMRRRMLAVMTLGALGATLPVAAQRRLWVVGYLGAGSARNDYAWLSAFRKGMAESGRIEGRDYVIDARFADGVRDLLPTRAAELIAAKPDVLLTPGDGTLPTVLSQTKAIPIVFATASDPVGLRFVQSLRRPGGNATGLSTQASDLGIKRLQILRDAFPQIVNVAVLFEPGHSSGRAQLAELEKGALELKLRITAVALGDAAAVESAFRRIAEARAEAVVGTRGVLSTTYRKNILDRVSGSGLPAIFESSAYADEGGLLSYGIATEDNFRRAASYVDKILKGAKAGELPIEQPAKLELVINLKTAKAMKLTIPQSVLLRADRVIQ